MSKHIGELIFLDQLAARFKLPVPDFLVSPVDRKVLKEKLTTWKKAVIKPDILSGKRNKVNSIRAVETSQEAYDAMQEIMNIKINGKSPRTTYFVEYIPAKYEIYAAIMYNSQFLGPSLTVSLKGGIDIEEVEEADKKTIPIDVYRGLDAYQASELLKDLACPNEIISVLSRNLVSLWDMFISTGMQMCEVNPWRVTEDKKIYICDLKAIFDEDNFKFRNSGITFPDYPQSITDFEEEMHEFSAASYQGQAHVSDLGGEGILPILFGGGASTIITETLINCGGDPIFLSDFGGNPPYERMYKTAMICFKHNIPKASLLLILGGKANNTLIDVTFHAIGDALRDYCDEHGPLTIPVVIGRGGPNLSRGFTIMKDILETLKMPYVIFGYDTPVTMVAEYAANLAKSLKG